MPQLDHDWDTEIFTCDCCGTGWEESKLFKCDGCDMVLCDNCLDIDTDDPTNPNVYCEECSRL